MVKYFLLARKIHRLFVIIISLLSAVMAVTGILMKYPSLDQILGLNTGQIRFIHNNLSPFLGIGLTVMIATGSIMYIFPLLRKK